MADVTIVLRGETAEKLRKLVADRNYAQPEDAVADALEALEGDAFEQEEGDAFDQELDTWLREVVVPRAKALEADPSRGLTPEEVLARLRNKP